MDITLDITTQDLELLKKIIELSSKNGLISPSDFNHVGNLYEKIDSIITNIDSLDND